eukprot:556324_1
MSSGQVKQWAEAQENLDIYQINAFIIGTGQRKLYAMGLWKMMACIGLQIIGIIFLTVEQWDAGGFNEGDSVCQGYNGDGEALPWMAFFFVSFVSITCGEQLRTLGQYGMYQWGSEQPDFVSKIWVAMGLWANIIVLIMSWLCSVIIIYTSTTMLDMVLNAVAVLFMITIDDEIVTFSDYENVLKTMSSYSSQSKAGAIFDKIGGGLLKIQILWGKPIICTAVLTPLIVVPPLFTILCYSPDGAMIG